MSWLYLISVVERVHLLKHTNGNVAALNILYHIKIFIQAKHLVLAIINIINK